VNRVQRVVLVLSQLHSQQDFGVIGSSLEILRD
jgi:hypothetical protein